MLVASALACRHAAQPPSPPESSPFRAVAAPIQDDLGYALAWSPDGKILAVAHLGVRSFELSVIRADDGVVRSRREICDAAFDVHALCFRPDGTAVATGGDDGVVRAFPTEDGAPTSLKVGEGITGCAWTDAGLVLSGAGGSVTAVEAGRTWKAHEGRANAVVAANGGVLTVGDDGMMREWSLQGGERRSWRVGGFLNDVQVHEGVAVVSRSAIPARRTPALYEDERAGRYPAVSSENAPVVVRLDGEGMIAMAGHRGAVVSAALWKGSVVSTGWDDSVRVFDASTGKARGALALPWLGWRVRVSPDGKRLAVLGWARPPAPFRSGQPTVSLYAWE
ncbi:MAG: hypothetical protein AB2A00_12060 [Myxococcota bacterium]